MVWVKNSLSKIIVHIHKWYNFGGNQIYKCSISAEQKKNWHEVLVFKTWIAIWNFLENVKFRCFILILMGCEILGIYFWSAPIPPAQSLSFNNDVKSSPLKPLSLYQISMAAIGSFCLWMTNEKQSSLKPFSQIDWNLVGSRYGRFCIKLPRTKMVGELHRFSLLKKYSLLIQLLFVLAKPDKSLKILKG